MNLNQNQHDILFLDIILQNVMQFNQPGLTDNQISKLPKIKITGSQIRVHKSCMVCLEDFQLNDEALMLSCFVSFNLEFMYICFYFCSHFN